MTDDRLLVPSCAQLEAERHAVCAALITSITDAEEQASADVEAANSQVAYVDGLSQ
jgi:hypothetical protein